jgi:hypothetical protein
VVIIRYPIAFAELESFTGLTATYAPTATHNVYIFTAGTGNIRWAA